MGTRLAAKRTPTAFNSVRSMRERPAWNPWHSGIPDRQAGRSMASNNKSMGDPKAQTNTPSRQMNAANEPHNRKKLVRDEEPPRWSWTRLGSLDRVVTTFGPMAMVVLVGIQTCYNHSSINEGTEQFDTTIVEIRRQSETLSRIFKEQQRARLSFRVDVEEVNDQDPAVFRIVCPFEIGGTTEAQRVVIKNYYSVGPPRQQEYLSSVDVDWDTRDGHALSDVSPTESDRRFVSAPLNRKQIATIVSKQQSVYFIGRIEYCDIYGECRYFMRCAELGNRLDLVTYCGTQIGDLADDSDDGHP